MTGPTGPEINRRPHLREIHAASTHTTAVDLTTELTPDEIDRAHQLAGRSRTWLLIEYRRQCRDRGLSSLGRVFSEWLPAELARALVLLDRPPTARFNNGATYRFE